MSLRSVHVLFIVTAIALLAFLTYWSGVRVLHGENSMSRALVLASAGGMALAIPYLAWFVKKTKHLR